MNDENESSNPFKVLNSTLASFEDATIDKSRTANFRLSTHSAASAATSG